MGKYLFSYKQFNMPLMSFFCQNECELIMASVLIFDETF